MKDVIIRSHRKNHSYLVTTITKCDTEFTPSPYLIIIRCQDSLKTFWLCATQLNLSLAFQKEVKPDVYF